MRIRQSAPVTLGALLWLAVLGGCHGEAAPATGTMVDTLPGGAVRVRNSAAVEWQDTTGWKLVLEHTIGDNDGVTFTSPRSLAVSAGHEIFVLDRKPAQIKVFDAEGKFERTIGRMGAGPGEYDDYGDLLIVRDTLVVNDRGHMRFVTFSVAGTPTGEHPGSRLPAHWPATHDGRFPVAAYLVQRPSTPADNYAGAGAVFFKLDGTRADSTMLPPEATPATWALKDATHDLGALVPFVPGRVVTFNHRGQLIWGDQGTYRLIVSQHGSDSSQIIEARATPVPIADSIRAAELASTIKSSPWASDIAKLTDIPRTYPLWTDLAVDGDDNIWVLRPGARTVGDSWDVFAPDGHLRGTVAAPFHHADETFWTATHAYVIDESRDGVPVVRIYRIVRPK